MAGTVSDMVEEAPLQGVAVLARMAFAGDDLAPLGAQLLARTQRNPSDANAWMDLSIVAHLRGERELGLAMQEQALAIRQLFRLEAATGDPTLRVLALLVPGDLTENNALEFLLEGSDVQLDLLYVTPTTDALPGSDGYDLAIVAVGESDRNRPTLAHIGMLVRDWPTPVLDAPERISRLSRDTAASIIAGVPGVVLPQTARVDRATLAGIADGSIPLTAHLGDGELPLLLRPVDSHKGHGLARADTLDAIAEYLATHGDDEFYVTRFVEYRSGDGHYWKYRIVFIAQRPYLCHVAISEHYIVHYMSAGMAVSAEKRDLEARCMATFDADFARRHQTALALVAERFGLEYVGIDCSETPDGALLIFEADASLTIHAMDPVELYAYKQPQMRRVFDAFRALLLARAGRLPEDRERLA